MQKGESERRREVRLGEEGSPDGAQVHPALKGFDHSVTSSFFSFFFVFKLKLAIQMGAIWIRSPGFLRLGFQAV